MKSFILKPSLAILILFLCGCSKIDWKNIFHHSKNPNVVINRPVKAPVAINFLDANRLLSVQIPNVTVTLMDTLGQVVTPNNLAFSTLEITKGVLSVALKENAVFSEDIPYRFTIKAESPGYISTFRSILIYKDSAQYVPIFMTKIQDPPVGMAGFTGVIPITNSTAMTNISLTPNFNNKVARNVSVVIPEGTVLMSNGKPLNQNVKNITYNFLYGSPTTVEALRTFPGGAGGTLISDAWANVVERGFQKVATPSNPMYFISSGWMTLEMNSGNEKLNGFSKPVSLTMPIEKSLINPFTKKPYQAGDYIPSWSLNDQGVWIEEEVIEVKSSNDGLIAVINIKHLSVWNLDIGSSLCSATKVIPYTNSTAATVRGYCEIVSYQNGLPFGLFPGFDINPLDFLTGPGRHHDIKNAPSTGDLSFLVYESESGPGGPTRASSSFNCGTAPPMMTIAGAAGNSLRLQFQYLRTPTASNPLPRVPICNNAVFFLPTALASFGRAYLYGGILGRRNVITDVGETTLYQQATFDAGISIRLYYGTLVSNAETNSYPIDFTFNVTLNDGIPHQVESPLANGVTFPGDQTQFTYQYFSTGNYWLISIPVDGFGAATPIAPCIAP